MVAKKLHNKYVCKRELETDERGWVDVPKFKYFNGRKYRAVMHGMAKEMAMEVARDARKRGFYARLVVYMESYPPKNISRPVYALYVCNTESKTELEARDARDEFARQDRAKKGK